jgi:glycine betaine/proline transport system permease protein
LVGFAVGAWGFFSERAERVIKPTLDFLQTIPAFAYLLPILLLFGFGTTVGLLASLIYSFPPMVRNTILGLRQVPSEIIESGIMSGASGRQLFWLVRVPTAWKQILLGVNQTTMASLSMVIIASIIGGTADIGWEVLVYLRKAQFGGSLVAGIVIALIAMILDRITSGLAKNSVTYKPREKSFLKRNVYWFVAIFGVITLYFLSYFFPIFNQWPESFFASPANIISDGLDAFIFNFGTQIDYFKQIAFFFIMLPIKIGLQFSVSPYTWGFELTPTLISGYFISMGLLAVWIFVRGYKNLSIGIILFSIFFYFGLTNMPWLPLILIYGLIGYKIGGLSLALSIISGLSFITLTGVLPQALLSIYLCGIAVIVSFLIGSSLGIWAAHNDRVSAFMRPINDTMQTMPSFVILIPFVMIFKIGEFTALLAIIAYAFVPAMRYTEHGLRNLPETVIEAAKMIGCSNSQLLWKVKIPLAFPVIMLGLNQTIMFGLAMLVIAALVGTTGLGQLIYIGLSKANFGLGMIAGISIAIIAILFDRVTQALKVKLEKNYSS